MRAHNGGFLPDTNLVSYWISHTLGRTNNPMVAEAVEWFQSMLVGSRTILSFATVAELRRWVISTKDPVDRDRIGSMVNELVELSYLIHGSREIADSWAMIANEAKALGKMRETKPLSTQINDTWIAASAHASNLTLLTCDTGFGWMADIGVRVQVYRGKQ